MKPFSLFLAIFIFFIPSSVILNASSNVILNTKGGVYIHKISNDKLTPDAFLDNQQLLTISYKDKSYLLYGIPYGMKLGKNNINIMIDDNSYNLHFIVKPKFFDVQNIIVDKKYIKPSLENKNRIDTERRNLKVAKDYWYNNIPDLSFIIPADGITTGRFGTKRFYNGEEGNPHNGLDIGAKKGTLIIAPSGGKIILTGNYYYNGKFILLDHGKGLKSIFIHLDEILVKKGQVVSKGENIGKIGNTGKSSGPHLHWSLLLNKTYINPEYFLSNQIIDYFSLKIE